MLPASSPGILIFASIHKFVKKNILSVTKTNQNIWEYNFSRIVEYGAGGHCGKWCDPLPLYNIYSLIMLVLLMEVSKH